MVSEDEGEGVSAGRSGPFRGVERLMSEGERSAVGMAIRVDGR
jgi:hypothetical protein